MYTNVKMKPSHHFWLGVCLRKLTTISAIVLPLLAWGIIPLHLKTQSYLKIAEANRRYLTDVLEAVHSQISCVPASFHNSLLQETLQVFRNADAESASPLTNHREKYSNAELQAHIYHVFENISSWNSIAAEKRQTRKYVINFEKDFEEQLVSESKACWWKSPALYLIFIILALEVYGFWYVFFWNRHAKMSTKIWATLQEKLDMDEERDGNKGACHVLLQKDFLENYKPNMVGVYNLLNIMHYRLVFDWGRRKRYFEMDVLKLDGKRWAFPAFYKRTTKQMETIEKYFKSFVSPRQVWEQMTCHNEPRCVRQYDLMTNSCQTVVQEMLMGQGIVIFTWRDWLPYIAMVLINRGRKLYKKYRRRE